MAPTDDLFCDTCADMMNFVLQSSMNLDDYSLLQRNYGVAHVTRRKEQCQQL